MTIIFAGAPVVNAIIAMIIKPPAGGWGSVHPLFWVGLICAVCGGGLVTKFKPGPPPPKKVAPTAAAAVPQKA